MKFKKKTTYAFADNSLHVINFGLEEKKQRGCAV
jgi:hypothetical protein